MIMVMVTDQPFDNCQQHETRERPVQRARTKSLNRLSQDIQKYSSKNGPCSEACQRGLMPNKPTLGEQPAAQSRPNRRELLSRI
jgi:hypothetical protein